MIKKKYLINKTKFNKEQIKCLINLYVIMMEEGYKIRNRVCKKEKYNIAQNESFVQIGVG